MTVSHALENTLAEHGRTVLRICTAILGDGERGGDAAQDTWLRYLRTCEHTPIENPGGWLRRTATSCAIDLLRRETRSAPSIENAEPCEPPRADPARAVAAREFTACLDQELPLLPESQRIVFRLRTEAGLSLAEIADDLGLALPTVKTHFARACVRLQSTLRAFSPEGTQS